MPLSSSPQKGDSSSEILEEVERLGQLIHHHNLLYFEKDSPELSDSEYDGLVQRYKILYQSLPDSLRTQIPSVISNNVGGDPSSSFQKVRHSFPMLSLDNGFEKKDIEDFFQRTRRFLSLSSEEPLDMTAEPKIDGLSATLHYRDGRLVLGATRGNGREGENITDNIKTIQDIPHHLESQASYLLPSFIEVRGEIYMTQKDFLVLNQRRSDQGEPLFANPRNAAAGSVRQLDPSLTAQRPLRFFAYSLTIHSPLSSPFLPPWSSSQWEDLQILSRWGFSVVPQACLCPTLEEALAAYEALAHERPFLPYDMDGVVYKVNRHDLQGRLGTSTRAPRYAIAHKFPAQEGKTRVVAIEVQVGRTGVLTPVAHLDPLPLGGVVVTRASLHNADEIDRLDIRVGDTVVVKRAGDVIPQILSVIKEDRSNPLPSFDFPTHCPCCQSPVISSPGEVADRCSGGLSCPQQAIEKLKHFVSRQAFDITGLGHKSIEFFFHEGLVKHPGDFFTLEERDRQTLTPLRTREGWGSQSVKQLFEAIQEKKSISLSRFLYSLGIPGIGLSTARLLAKHYQSLEAFLKAFERFQDPEHPDSQELLQLEGVGPVVLRELALFQQRQNQYLEELLGHIHVTDERAENNREAVNHPLAGKSIVFTGTLSQMSRSEAKATAERVGAKVSQSLSPKTDFLIAGDQSGKKMQQALSMNIRILTEKEWTHMASLRF